MAKMETNPNTQHFDGLVKMVVIIALLLASPVVYFAVQLLLGHADLFAINGFK